MPKFRCCVKGSITIRWTAIPCMMVNFFNFRIFVEVFIHEVKKTSQFWVSGSYLYSKYHLSRFFMSGHFLVRIYRDFNFYLYDTVPT